MNINQNVIIDLLPLYYSREASEESRKLIEKYFSENPEFAKQMEQSHQNMIAADLPPSVTPEDEMIVLFKTKRFLKIRSWVFFLAILFSALPFSFYDVSWSQTKGPHWLWIENPMLAILFALLGLSLWVVYYTLNKRLDAVNL